MRQIFLALLLTLLSLAVQAQTLTNSERRQINSRVLTAVEEYERFSSLYDDEAEYYFETLFANDAGTTVFCDMLGMPSYLKEISVSEYIKLLRSQSLNTTVTIKDVVKGDMTFDNGEWLIPVRFRKSISYIDQGGYVFSVNEYYKTDFNMVMNLCYNPDADRCFVRSIKGSIASDKSFPEGRFAIVEQQNDMDYRTARYMSTLKIDGKPLEYNQFGQAIISKGEAKVNDADVAVSTETKYEGFNYDVLTFRFVPRNQRVRFHYGIAPFAYGIKHSNEFVTGKSSAHELSIDWGYAVPLNDRSKMSFNVGAGLSFSSLKLEYNPTTEQTYQCWYVTPDKRTGQFVSKYVDYKIYSASESIKYVDAFVPVYVEMEHIMNRIMTFSWNVGFKAYFAMGAQADSPYRIKAEYDKYHDNKYITVTLLTPEEDLKKPYFIEANTYAKNDFDVSAMANLGLDIDLYQKRLYAMVRVGYEFGLMKEYVSSGAGGYKNKNQVIYLYDNASGRERHVAMNSLISGLDFRRNSLWISFGVKFKM